MQPMHVDTGLSSLKFCDNLLALLCNQISAYMYIKDNNGRYIYINDMTRMLYGLPEGTNSFNHASDVFSGEDLEDIEATDQNVIKHGKVIQKYEEITCRTTGKQYHYKASKIPLLNNKNKVIGILGVSADVTDLIEKERQMALLADTDSLTGLANRRCFMRMAEKELSRIRRHGGTLSLVIGDIDYFKQINDTYGHHVGDLILKNVSHVLNKSIRLEDSVARIGGEEFAMLLPNTNITGGYIVADKIRTAISDFGTFVEGEGSIRCTMSMGIATLDEENDYDLEKLLCEADKALYKAKHSGRNCVVCATAECDELHVENIQQSEDNDLLARLF